MNLQQITKKVFNRVYPSSRYQKISYSQCGEDLIVQYIFQNIIKKRFFNYIDIGAHHPFKISNTALFYLQGNSGVTIEPNPELYQLFKKFRRRDINLNVGVGPNKEKLVFYNLSDSALSTFVKHEADHLVNNGRVTLKNEVLIDLETLNDIIENYCKGIFPDFLSLDVEGLDEKILKSINYSRSKPKVICVETIKYNKDGTYEKSNIIIDYLRNNGYSIYGETRINTIFISDEYLNYKL